GRSSILTPAASAAGARCASDDGQLIAVVAACVPVADGLKDVLHVETAPLVLAVHDRAAVEHHAGQVQAGHGHDDAGNGLVTARDAHEAVEEMAAHHQLDGIRDPVPADEGCLHALGAHGDAVRHRDGVELDRRAAGGPDPLL